MNGPLWAGSDARLALEAALGPIQQFKAAVLAFGVMAPIAAERAALEKHGGTQTRPVVYREAADIEDNPSECRFGGPGVYGGFRIRLGGHSSAHPI